MDAVDRLVRGSIDMHVHMGPDAHLARSVDALQAAAQAEAAGAEGRPPAIEDTAAFVRSLLEEKPHLRGASAGSPTFPRTAEGLPPKTAGAGTASVGAPRRAMERLAEQARGGGAKDLMAYMRARRGQA